MRFAYLEQFIEGDYFRYSLGTKYPVVEFMVTKGITGVLNSAYDYTKSTASVKDKMKISPLGTLSYKVYAGKDNRYTCPLLFWKFTPATIFIIIIQIAFNLMNRFEYISDQYAGINVEHNMVQGSFGLPH